ncbi:MAG: efflux RND transporter periplasmic adaptor subunit [Balneolaceae bacterium]
MKKFLIISAIIVVIALLAIPKVQDFSRASSSQSVSGANSDSRLTVDVHVVEPQVFENKIFTTGSIIANEEIDLNSEVSGKITNISFEEGRGVEKGQLLLKINDNELQAELQRANYRLKLAEERENRQAKLLEKGGISQEDYDATLNELNILKAETALINAQIEKTEIRAPFSGNVGLKYVSEGSYISPTTRIATLQSLNPIKIDFSIPERYSGVVEVGDRLSFTVQGADGDFEATIYAIEPRVNNQTRTLSIRARGENPDGLLLPGAFANLNLILQEIEEALLVPTIAVIPDLQGQKVFLYKNGKVEENSVDVGIRTEDYVQITNGISAGDTVLTTGLLQVQEGTEVRIGENINAGNNQ